MIKINKEIYYHANSGDELKIGDILVFNENTNNRMYDSLYNSEYSLNNMDANSILCTKRNDKDLTNEEYNVVLNTVNNDAFVMRELALEEVRKERFSNYPSRLKCLYVTKEKDDAFNWAKILKRNNKICKQIITFELTGDLFIGDGNLMKRQNLSYSKHLDNALNYWSNSTKEENEYLFYGTAKVISIDDYKE